MTKQQRFVVQVEDHPIEYIHVSRWLSDLARASFLLRVAAPAGNHEFLAVGFANVRFFISTVRFPSCTST